MGALTENRKRRLAVDFRLPFSPHPVFDLAAEPSPPSKKARFPSPTAEARPLTSPTPAAGIPSSPLRRFPPAAPLPRPVHAPQRILRAFGLGSAHPSRSRLPESSLTQERDSEMGNLVARFLHGKKTASFTPWRMGKRGDASARSHGSQGSEDNDGSDEVLDLDQYKKLVNKMRERNLEVSNRKSVEAVFAPTPSGLSELTIVTQKPEQTTNLHLVNRKVEDARKLMVESSSLLEEKASVSRSPLYKELYVESARRHDSKLRNLELEVKLAEQKVSSFRFTHQGQETNIKEVINLYLELLKEREKRESKKFLKCHFFNTFFFKKARYFVDEVKDKSDIQVDALSWKLEAVRDLPLQKNGYATFF
ncbi:hypothetical protein GW17_00001247 [Ensete ventricosum]|nr:hypothetical protein GW17_00001247 [Ensete ventricosum]